MNVFCAPATGVHRTRALRVAAVLATTVGLLLMTAGPAAAVPLLPPEEADSLASSLAEASAEQDICYGWEVALIDNFGTDLEGTTGSSAGPGVPVEEAPGCEQYVELAATITYTAATSESSDSATWQVRSTVDGLDAARVVDRLEELGLGEDALLGAQDDVTIYNAAAALPLVVAELDHAPYLTLAPNTEPIPAADQVTGSPTSDFLRNYGWALFITVLLTLGGVGWLGYELLSGQRAGDTE